MSFVFTLPSCLICHQFDVRQYEGVAYFHQTLEIGTSQGAQIFVPSFRFPSRGENRPMPLALPVGLGEFLCILYLAPWAKLLLARHVPAFLTLARYGIL